MRRLLGFALAAFTVAAMAAPAAAVAPVATAWWWKLQTSGRVPPPPTVPGGGLMVAADPSGASAVAALRYELDADQGAPILTLTVAKNGDVNGANAVIAACRTGSAWTSTYAGRWDAKPTAVCATSVNGIRAADGSSYTFALAPLLVGHVLDVVLVPKQGSPTFSLTFDGPSSTSLKTSTVAASTFPESSDASVPSFAADTPAVDTGSVTPVDAAPFTPALPPAEQVLTATAPAVEANTAANARAPRKTTGDSGASGLAFVLLLAAGAAAWGLSKQPTPPLRALGPMTAAEGGPLPVLRARTSGEPQMGGLGRFARVRSGEPPRL